MAQWEYTKGLHQVAEGIYAYLDPPGLWGESNCGLVVDSGQSLVVDTRYDLELTGEMIEAMKAVPGAIPADYLVNTHADGDHIFGNELLKEAEIIASKACAEALATEITPQMYAELLKNAPDMGKLGRYFTQAFGKFKFEGITLTPPTRTFENFMKMKVGNKDVHLIQVGPAHTGGDVMVHLPGDRVIFTGDIIMTAAAPVSWEGPLSNVIKALDLIIGLDIDVLVPGHGPLANKSAAQKSKAYWEYTATEARTLFDRGVSAVEAAKTLSAVGRYTGEAHSMINMINLHMLYRDFSGDESPPDKAGIIGHIADLMFPD